MRIEDPRMSNKLRARLARTLKWARSVHFYSPLISGQVLIQLPFGKFTTRTFSMQIIAVLSRTLQLLVLR